MTVARLVARSVRGIERLLAEEIRRLGLGTVERVGHREVRFTSRAGPGVLNLRTADDVFVVAAEVEGISSRRADLGRLRRALTAVDLDRVLRLRERCGGPPAVLNVDVSASFLGRRAYNRYDLEDAVGEVLAERLSAGYHSRRGGLRPPPGGLTWRLTAVDDRATLALRVPQRPLHRRPYKIATIPGTLHPPLAAAMVTLAGLRPGQTVLDPCCGAGTVPIEAACTVAGVCALGLDADAAALAASVGNGRHTAVTWARADAGALPIDGGCAHRVVLNPPWGRQVRPRGLLAADPGRLWREVRRVLAPNGRVVALLHQPGPDRAHITAAGLEVGQELPVSLCGAHPVLVVMQPT